MNFNTKNLILQISLQMTVSLNVLEEFREMKVSELYPRGFHSWDLEYRADPLVFSKHPCGPSTGGVCVCVRSITSVTAITKGSNSFLE